MSDSGSVTEWVAGSKTGGLRSASAKDAASGPVATGVELAQGVARDVDVDALERAAAEVLLHAEDLEEVELEVAQVAPEVAHRPAPPTRR